MRSNEELVGYLVERGVISRSVVREAFLAVDRAFFVPKDLVEDAYLNQPLPIGEGQTISQPLTVALMLEELAVREGMRVLDVGCGSGYSTALLKQLVGSSGEVFGVERVESLVEFCCDNLQEAGVNASVHLAGEVLGLPQEQPFNRVLVSAEANAVPDLLVSQLVDGGLLVLPVNGSLLTVKREGSSFIIVNRRSGFRFVPLIE